MVLQIQNLTVNYGGIRALRGINLSVPAQGIITLIGANGAGKSTLLRTVVGLVTPNSGTIVYNGKSLLSMKTKDIVRDGVVLIPEGRKIFSNLTVYENLILGAYKEKNKTEVQKTIKDISLLFPRLAERKYQKAGTLSGGEQQMLAVGRALMAKPKLLMMDEPSLGLAPLLVRDIFKIIKEIRTLDVTILLIEQNAKAALEIADYAYVLETGSIVLEGTGADLLNDEKVKKAYLAIKTLYDS